MTTIEKRPKARTRKIGSVMKYLKYTTTVWLGEPRGKVVTKPLSATYRRKVIELYVHGVSALGLVARRETGLGKLPSGQIVRLHTLLRPTNPLRECLVDAVFTLENEIESRGGGRRYDPVVLTLNAIRLKIEDDLWGSEEV